MKWTVSNVFSYRIRGCLGSAAFQFSDSSQLDPSAIKGVQPLVTLTAAIHLRDQTKVLVLLEFRLTSFSDGTYTELRKGPDVEILSGVGWNDGGLRRSLGTICVDALVDKRHGWRNCGPESFVVLAGRQ